MLSFCPGSGAIIGPFVVVAKGVKIGDEAIIEASCLIGEDTIIGKRVVIGQRVVIGNDCDIRDDVVLGKDAVIGTRSTIERGLRIPGGYKVPTNSHLRNLTANEAAEVTAASSMYCSCTAPKIITNIAGGNVFQYCQRCKKEYI
jgi:carbonic anhydrase/acetyltransferase-like protein (isoleucine patch superfamily)